MSSVDLMRKTNASGKGTKRSGTPTGGKGGKGKKGKSKEEYQQIADNLSAENGAPLADRAPRPAQARGSGKNHLPGQGVGAGVTSPATWSEPGFPPLRGGRGDPHGDPRFRTLNFSCGQCFKEVLC